MCQQDSTNNTPACIHPNSSSETMKNIINNIVSSSKFRTFVILFALLTVTSFATRLLSLFLSNEAGKNQLFTDISSLVMMSAADIIICIGLWRFRKAFLSQSQTSISAGLNLIKSAAFFLMLAIPGTLLINLIESKTIADIVIRYSLDTQVIAILIAITALMFIIIFSPIALYYIFIIRTINFIKKLYKSDTVRFPAKTIAVLGVVSHIAGIAILLLSGINASSFPLVLRYSSAILNFAVYFMMGNILLNLKKSIQQADYSSTV